MAGAATAGSAMSAVRDVAKLLEANYRNTPKRLRMLDLFLVFVFATGVLQVRACCFVLKQYVFVFNPFLR